MPGSRPHILILMTDQQRADCMSAVGHPLLRTPNMDRLAAEGTLFTDACTVSPLCMPARASFLSGRWVHNHFMWANDGHLAAGDESLFRRLRDNGYRTCHVGKSHYYNHDERHLAEWIPYMRCRGFDDVHETTGPWATLTTDSCMADHWAKLGLLESFRQDYRDRRRIRREQGLDIARPSPLPVEEFSDSFIGRRAVEYIAGYDDKRPMALFVGFGGPHEPFDAPGEYATMFRPADAPAPIQATEPGEWAPDHAAQWQRHGRRTAMKEDDFRAVRANYYGKIALVDRWFGEILAACERKGMLEDMLIVFWSDHGDMLGDHGLMYKSRFFETSLRIPLIVRLPGCRRPRQCSSALAQTVDIMPTVLAAVGIEPPATCQGLSLMPLLENPSAPLRDAAFIEVAAGNGNRISMVRTMRHKYEVDQDGRGLSLYDLEADPEERNNLLGHPDSIGTECEMRERLLRFHCTEQLTMPKDFWREC